MSKLDTWTFKEIFKTLKDFVFYVWRKIFDFHERSTFKLLLSLVFFGLSLFSLFVILNPALRKKVSMNISSIFERPYRKILSSSSSYLFSDKRFFKILKFKHMKVFF